MPEQHKNEGRQEKPDQRITRFQIWFIFLVLWVALIAHALWTGFEQIDRIPYSQFLTYLDQGGVEKVLIKEREIVGTLKTPPPGKPKHFTAVRVDQPDLASRLAKKNVQFTGVVEDTFLRDMLSWVIPVLIFFGIWAYIIRRATKEGMGAGGLMSIGRSKARTYLEEQIKTRFSDVAGADEAKEELQEVVNFLKDRKRYTRLGGRMPKGILLVGPPGTGKTLLARAVAGEAGVPFFSISGSEFVEMFVGVGAARVRDLFQQAQEQAPCIIFIDELDALGRARGLNPIASHDEKEQTLNQLLVEMDGFDPRQGVVMLAATNRPEILDPALLRAGRFDRQVFVDRPDKGGRLEILKLHLAGIKVATDLDVDKIAGMTPGFTGADLANLVNEAALLAARRNADYVTMSEISEAIERLIAGLEKKKRLLSRSERERVAFHETGHALVALTTPGSDPVHKVSIIPRGVGALGYTLQQPTEDRYLMSRQELDNKMTVLLGGRAAEVLVFDEVSTGAADDLAKATELARNMVMRFGMGDKLGLATYESEPHSFLPQQLVPGFVERRFSEETAREIDCEVRNLVDQAFERATAVLRSRRRVLEVCARELLERETLTHDELHHLLEEHKEARAGRNGARARPGK